MLSAKFCAVTIIIALKVFDSVSSSDSGIRPIVKINQGEVQGIQLNSRGGRPYNAFLGIPYMKTPEKFMPPSFDPPENWNGTLDASTPGSRCLQHDGVMNKNSGSLDCHFINVYTPKIAGNYSTILYIHGGGFQWGTGGIHGADYLLDEDTILCTFNYRLGAMGFLSTGDSVIKGNMGMLDQVVALRWVRDNIRHFGGNGIVVLYGESAGAGSVSLHTLSPLSKGLFHGAIMSSGAALNPWSCLKNPKLPANELGKKLNCPIENSVDFLECLKTKDSQEILRKSTELIKWYIDPTVTFGPIVEAVPDSSDSSPVFLPKSPLEILSEGSFSRVPIIIGLNEEEGIYLHTAKILNSSKLISDLNNDWNKIAPITFTYYEDENASQSTLNTISNKIQRFYLKDEPVGENTRQALTNVYSDRYFNHGVRWAAQLYAKYTNVYPYIFTHQGNFSFVQQLGFPKGLGCTHKDDLQYVFSGIAPLLTGPDLELSQKLIKLIVNFASTRSPSLIWEIEKEWKPMSQEEADGKKPIQWLKLDSIPQFIEDPFPQRMKFWDELIKDYKSIIGPPRVKNITPSKETLKEEL